GSSDPQPHRKNRVGSRPLEVFLPPDRHCSAHQTCPSTATIRGQWHYPCAQRTLPCLVASAAALITQSGLGSPGRNVNGIESPRCFLRTLMNELLSVGSGGRVSSPVRGSAVT